jgi:hypothetical protein
LQVHLLSPAEVCQFVAKADEPSGSASGSELSSQRVEAFAELGHQGALLSDGPAKVVESLDQQLELLAPAPAASKATVERREPRLDAVDETCASFELSREVIELRPRRHDRLIHHA